MDPLHRYTTLPHAELVNLYRFVQGHPGLTIGALATRRGWSWSKMAFRLRALEAVPLLLYEDDRGRLYPFES